MTAIFGPSTHPPAGWAVFNGQLEPDTTAAGYFARGCEVKGRCSTRDCQRRCEIDFERLVKRGLGRLRVAEVKPLFRCHRLDGCSMEWREEGGMEITLKTLAGRDYTAVRISCEGCNKATIARPETVIAKLSAEGTGGAETPIAKLGELIRGPCPKCQARRWKAVALWHDPERLPEWFKRARR